MSSVEQNMNLVTDEWETISPNINPFPISHILNTSRNRNRTWKLHPRHQRYDYTWSEENQKLYIDSIEKTSLRRVQLPCRLRLTSWEKSMFIFWMEVIVLIPLNASVVSSEKNTHVL